RAFVAVAVGEVHVEYRIVEIRQRCPVVRPALQGLPEAGDGLAELALVLQRIAEIGEQRGIVGFDRERSAVDRGGFRAAALLAQQHAEIEQDLGGVWAELQGLPAARDRVVGPPQGFERKREIGERLRDVGIEGQRPYVGRHRLLQLAGLMETDRLAEHGADLVPLRRRWRLAGKLGASLATLARDRLAPYTTRWTSRLGTTITRFCGLPAMAFSTSPLASAAAVLASCEESFGICMVLRSLPFTCSAIVTVSSTSSASSASGHGE